MPPGLSRAHQMPFGYRLQPNGRFYFRLWAPDAAQVELCLQQEDHECFFPMQAEADGWFGLETAMAACGSLYRYRIDRQIFVSDPAARYQPGDVHGHSQVIDPAFWPWADGGWQGLPWEQAVIYELHVGTFTPQGHFLAVIDRLDYLKTLGISAIQLMPVADFPGERNWGYDGVLPFAPDSRYGAPDDLKALVQAAHAKGMMVFLDVVYNHFGPEGNYLHHYAQPFFHKRRRTPWGKAFNFDGRRSHWVRRFFIHNALYWLEEFNLDGLRFDAVQAIADSGQPHFLAALAAEVRSRWPARQIHLILENDDNAAHYLRRTEEQKPAAFTAQWNDDIHHALHVLLTGEAWGYYQDYRDAPLRYLSRCLAQGFAYQGEPSAFRNGAARGQASGHLPPQAFISFLQNHDQVGNRPHAERIHALAPAEAVRVATALLLLAPFPPMLFMGQEWGCRQPFAFFCDFEPQLNKRVGRARRREFKSVLNCNGGKARSDLLDPADESGFNQSVLDWAQLETTEAKQWLAFHRRLLSLRRRYIEPLLAANLIQGADAAEWPPHGLAVNWRLAGGGCLSLLANLGEGVQPIPPGLNRGRLLYALIAGNEMQDIPSVLPGWSLLWRMVDQA